MDLILKWLLFLIFAPVLVCLVLQLMVGIAAALLPWLLLASLVAGITAGITAGLMLRGRLPPRNGTSPLPPGAPPLGPYRIRRSRGGRLWR